MLIEPIQMLSVAIASSRAWAARSSIDQPSSPRLWRFSVIKIQIYHSRRLKGEESDSKSRRKKARGSLSLPCVQLQVFAELAPAAMIVVAFCAQKIVSKKKHWTVVEKNTLIVHIINA